MGLIGTSAEGVLTAKLLERLQALVHLVIKQPSSLETESR